MNIEIISDIKKFEMLQEAWNTLLHESSNNIVCLTHEWFIAWWKNFSDDSNRLYIITVFDSQGKMVAAAPMMLSNCAKRFRGRKICFILNSHSPSADFIIHRNFLEDSVAIIFRHLRTFKKWDYIELEKLELDSTVYSLVTDHCKRQGFLCGFKKNLETPYISVVSCWDDFLGNRSSKFRKVLRNKLNRVKRSGDISIESSSFASEKKQLFKDMLYISSKSWKKDIGEDLESKPTSKRFLEELYDRFGSKGLVNIWMLKKNGEPIAFEFHIIYNEVAYPLRADFDKGFKDISPGSILEHAILKTLFSEKEVREYNSCGSIYNYLLRWTDSTRKYMNIEIFNKAPRWYGVFFLEYKMLPLMRNLGIGKLKKIYYEYSKKISKTYL